MTLAVTSKGHIEGRGGKAPNIDLKYRVPYQTSMDGNTVDMDIERSQFADNTLKYQADLTFINSRVKVCWLSYSKGNCHGFTKYF